MNEKIYSPEKLLRELKIWTTENPKAEQLDGSIKVKNNPKVYCFVELNGSLYRLHLDTRRAAVERFIYKSQELGSPVLALKVEKTKSGRSCLRLKDGNFKSKGWYCYLAFSANSEKSHKYPKSA